MNGAFTIFYIIGNVTGDSGQDWSKLPGFVGVNHVFAAPREACDNCGNQEEQAHLVTGTTPMTSLLLDYVINGSLNSMEVEDVKPFLVKNLKWRAQTVSRCPPQVSSNIRTDFIKYRRQETSSIQDNSKITTR